MNERRTRTAFSFFTFFCPAGYEQDAQGLLRELGVFISPKKQPMEERVFAGETIRGSNMLGTCLNEQLPKVETSLREARIAGYDGLTRITQVPLKHLVVSNPFSEE